MRRRKGWVKVVQCGFDMMCCGVIGYVFGYIRIANHTERKEAVGLLT